MKTNRRRHDDETEELFEHERKLKDAVQDNDWSRVKESQRNLRRKLRRQKDAGIASSRGLDHFLQVAMAWITTYLGWRARSDSFRSTVSLYLPSLNAVLVKPSLVAPDKSRAPQPTISTVKSKPNFGYRDAIGHTGLVMVSEKILYCQPVAAGCDQYIPLEPGKSKAALCIPLKGDFAELASNFKTRLLELNSPVCSLAGQCSALSDRIGSISEDRIVLNIECISDVLTAKEAMTLVSDRLFKAVIQKIIDTLADYQKQRDTHRALEHSSTLLALATNTLRPRDAYRALLREISTACGGADVTLHLRDLFDDENEHRCIRFVTGIGKNFRDFLINERAGVEIGQVGWAMSKKPDTPPGMEDSTFDLHPNGDAEQQNVKVWYIAGDEITKSLKGENKIPFKQLMPNTFLNVTVPIYFQEIKMGVVNLEWDQETLERDAGVKFSTPSIDAHARQLIQQYLSECLPVVYRMADYLSLVIDYFDDVQNLIGRPKPEELETSDFGRRLQREGALRKVMRYYMKRGMTKANELAETFNSSVDQDEDKKFRAEASCLQDLVDAMGYFLAHISDLRILVSVRRRALDKDDSCILRHQTSHWLEGDKHDEKNRLGPIRINDPESVLAACVRLGVPLFGTVEDIMIDGKLIIKNGIPKRHLKLDERLTRKDPDSRFPQLSEKTVPYRPAGRDPRYEVGVPLIFGRNLLGTFDFEQFEQEKATTAPQPLEDHELCAHLEWSRAIAFLLAYISDAISPIAKSEKRLAAFRCFQALTAQLIAEVPVDREQFVAIAADSFAEIFPVAGAEVRELKKNPDNQNEGHEDDVAVASVDTAPPAVPQTGVARHLDLLRFRGVVENVLSWGEDQSDRRVLLRSHSELRPRSTMTSMMTAYHSLMLNLREDPEDAAFNVAIERTIVDLARAKRQLTDPARDAGEAVLNLFLFLHKSLRRNLVGLADEAEGGVKESEYAWFLHVRRFEPGDEFSSFGCEIETADTKKTVLAYCYTSEMKKIVEDIQKKSEDSSRAALLKAIESVLQERSKSPVQKLMLRVKTALPAEGRIGEQELIHALTVCLARSRTVKSGDPSLTLFVANAGGPIVVVPQINISPMRSERGYGWFWELTYTFLGIPFMLNDQCVAVLNIFRRRESGRDMKFFRIEERDKTKLLVSSVTELIEEIVDTRQIKPIPKSELTQKLQPLVRGLVARAERNAAKLIVVQSPFATSVASFEAFWDVVFAGKDTPTPLANAVRFPEHETSIQNRNVVVRIGKRLDEYERLGADLGLLVEQATRVFLFTARREDLLQRASEPIYAPYVPIGAVDATLLTDDTQQEEAYRDWLLGKAIVSTEGVQRKILFRGDDAKQEWTYRAFTDWLLERRRDSETADYYDLVDLIRNSSWRPDEKTLAVRRWGTQAATKGAPQ